MDELDRELMRSAAAYFKQAAVFAERESVGEPTGLGARIAAHLGTDITAIPVVSERVGDDRLVDADLALEELQAAGGGELIGVGGGDYRHHVDTPELVRSRAERFDVGPVDYAERPTGPDSSRRVVTLGVRLLRFQDRPLAVVQRAANERYGREQATLDVIGEDPEHVSAFVKRLRERMVAVSVLRRQVISLRQTDFSPTPTTAFLRRPEVAADEVILPTGVLAEISGHVLGIGMHRDLLVSLGQHLKRGVLLYGPAGTGKTLTVRHLVAQAEGSTVVLLRGTALAFIHQAATIARTFQPSIVVLEDVDLVAMERDHTPQPLLFEVLDAIDGLDGDADVAFVMTTNRVDVLEPALAERPGRVDLAVEIALPALPERRRLLQLYARELPLSSAAIQAAAERTEGTTGSFAKELIRSSVLLAANRGETTGDQHLADALDDLLGSGRRLTRRMLGGDANQPLHNTDEVEGPHRL